ncbi:MAG TPA: asparagine synthase-related protein, partial [Tepidisphaeraceae bacterium]|nr:asparagine synthase-related protein [Tepidisphaeraceae bacterium]
LADSQKRGEAVQGFRDVRKLLDAGVCDAISIATPNHTHALIGIWAAERGVHAYVEKPLSHDVWQGRQVVAAAGQYRTVIQTGSQCRSNVANQEAIAYLQSGALGRVLLARDRMGEKPLFLVERPGEIWFGSELKAFISARVIPFQLDMEAAWEYFHYSYVPEPRAAVVGIRKLPPGNIFTVELDSWIVKQKQYWSMEDAPPIEGDPPKVLRAEIERVFELIVRSDVPIGVALSGGIDSSAIASLAQKNFPGTIHAFTIGYTDEPRQDERSMAREFAEYAKIPFHPVILRDEDVIEDFPNMVWLRGDPIGDLAGPGYLGVMRAARAADIPVMLMGHGGDELFWGYQWVREAYRRSQAKRDVALGRGSIASYLHITRPPRSKSLGMRWLRGGGGIVRGINDYRADKNSNPDQVVFYDHSPEFRVARDRLPKLLGKDFLARGEDFDICSPYRLPLPWKDLDVHFIKMISMSYLLENGLAQCDRLAMATSVEGRMPLIDYKLVETVIGLMKTHLNPRPQAKTWL